MAGKVVARLLGWIVAAVMGLGLFGTAAAATPAGVNGITVAPVIQQLRLTSGQDSADFNVRVTNNTAYPVQIKLGFNDFKALNDTGGVAFLGQNATSVEQSHGLASWVHLSASQLGLDAGASATATVHLSDLLSLSPGGHYGAVTYQALKASPNGNGNRVTINQVLTSLVFLVTAGGGTEHVKMLPPHLGGVQTQIPTSMNLFFTDTGNTQTTPHGALSIDSGNAAKPVATAVLNPNGALVLPGSTRLIPTQLTTQGRPWWPREYHVHIVYRAESEHVFQSYTTSFLYLNPWFFVVLLVLGALAVLVIRRSRRKPQNARALAGVFRKLFRRTGNFFVEVIAANIAYVLVRLIDAKKSKAGKEQPPAVIVPDQPAPAKTTKAKKAVPAKRPAAKKAPRKKQVRKSPGKTTKSPSKKPKPKK